MNIQIWGKSKCFETKRDGTKTWLSLQLPIYCAMLDADSEGVFAGAKLEKISSCYCVLGKTAGDVVFSDPMNGAFVPEAEALVRELVGRIERGIFWPPAPSCEGKYDYEDWLSPSPEDTVDEDWINDQKSRLAHGGAEV